MGDIIQGRILIKVFLYSPSKDCHPVQLLEKLKEAVAGQKLNYHQENPSVLNTTLLTMQM